ncbi:MAG: hypothetical protein DMF65_07215, partial [Acidobacteria bacterium]
RDDLYPLRVLTVSSAEGKNRNEAGNRLRTLHSMLSVGDAVKLVSSDISSPTTPEILRRDVQALRPHVLHFEASVVPSNEADGSVENEIFLGGQGTLKLSELIPLLQGVQLVTFGNNHDGGFLNNPLLELIDGLVAEVGLPAAVAATRPVEESSALTFWRGFYRAWLNGKSIEEAVATARAELSGGLDWSAFALFGNPSVVGRLSLPRAAA